MLSRPGASWVRSGLVVANSVLGTRARPGVTLVLPECHAPDRSGTSMVAVRNGLRGLAVTGAGPATLLGWLNVAACHFTEPIVGTAVFGLYDPCLVVVHVR